MKIYDYSGRANISGTEYIRRERPSGFPKMPSPPRCRSAVLVLVGRPSAASRPATAS